jgi:hypothetical protein
LEESVAEARAETAAGASEAAGDRK